MKHSETISSLAQALVSAQKELSNPEFDKYNPHFKNRYASLVAVRAAVLPVFNKFGLAVSQHLQKSEGGVGCETVILHQSGEWMSSEIFIPTATSKAQEYGSACTYARRYALQSIAGVVGDEDDDGEPPKDAAQQLGTDFDSIRSQLATVIRSKGRGESDAALQETYKKYGIEKMEAIAQCTDLEALNDMIEVVKKLPNKKKTEAAQ